MTSPNPQLGYEQVPPPTGQQQKVATIKTDVVVHRQRGLDLLPFARPHEAGTGGGNGAAVGNWWGSSSKPGSRPWHNTPKRRKTVPPNQEIAYERTKAAMQKVASSFFNDAADISIEALRVVTDVLEAAPLVGVGEAARVLLTIWQGVQAVETNRLSCLRLTERCATILYSVRSEVNAAGTDVADLLQEPMNKLLDTFREIQHFVHTQVSRPFLKRYLKRDEDAWKIAGCDASLTDSVGMFGVAIQLRTLKEVREQSAHLLHPDMPTEVKPHEIVDVISACRAAQAAHDYAHDAADLYATMRAALRVGDVAILELLQIDRGEMQEAIKTLQRALEDPRLSSPISPSRPGPSLDIVGHMMSPMEVVGHLKSPMEVVGHLKSPLDAGHLKSPLEWGHMRSPLEPGTPAPFSALPSVSWDPEQDAAFHREFLEGGLDALRRLSGSDGESLPPWTITRWEVDREGKIGMGFFSDVYKGKWRDREVAIKILAPTTPRKLFRREISIWASLKHTHVLELLGASSATGDPPWFFVSPYMKNGTVVSYLKAAAAQENGRGPSSINPGPLQMMHEIAVGMAYLHRKGVLHGDLKANNVLIDDDLHCVISDFGQSELRSEVYRLSHRPQPHGTLRWQAPEILSAESVMTPEADVYSFAIVCVEILTNGELPWPMLDDQAVQQLVLRSNKRPKIPLRPEMSLSLVTLIEGCWSTDPLSRPLFDTVARGLGQLMDGLSRPKKSPSPKGRVRDLIREKELQRSPDMAPIDLPDVSEEAYGQDVGAAVGPLVDLHEPEPAVSISPSTIPLQRVVTPSTQSHAYVAPATEESEAHDGVGETLMTSSPTASAIFSPQEGDAQEGGFNDEADDLWDGYESPPPRDTRVAAMRDERRYRLLLQHDFHPSLNLPLWEPLPVRLGAVGYLSKPSGRFVTLFNALSPWSGPDSRVHGLPSIFGYGSVRQDSARQDKRNIAQIGIDMIQGLLTFRKGSAGDGTFSRSVKKRYSYPLRAGHKHAYLCTEGTVYRYMVNLDAAKAWFKSNVREIVRLYGRQHKVQREDVFLVIGALEARDYGLFVSHDHPYGQVHFNVYTDRRVGQDWGSFSTDSDILAPGPKFNTDVDVPDVATVHATKISRVRAASDSNVDAVLLARLRFKPDEDEPTRL